MARKRKIKEEDIGKCGDCSWCSPVTRFHTLTVKDRKPTLGNCPFMERRRVLLSEKGCIEYKLRDKN